VSIEYHVGDEKDLDRICDLWAELNRCHIGKSVHFRHHYEEMTFSLRKSQLEYIARQGSLRIDLAKETETNREVGYCISSITGDRIIGEIESIFVDTSYRRRGIGTILVRNAFAWMDSQGVEKKRVSVSYGNEETWAFYQSCGLLPRMTILEQVP
jgi:ribosomal protein S18 acetylase RimI-like enzyme